MSLDYAWQDDFTDLTLSFRREEKSYLYWHYSVTRTSVMSLGYANKFQMGSTHVEMTKARFLLTSKWQRLDFSAQRNDKG
jgi:hypothetical protein